MAVAKTLPQYNVKSSRDNEDAAQEITTTPITTVAMALYNTTTRAYVKDTYRHHMHMLMECVRGCARLVDMPPNVLNTDSFIEYAR